jgi:hypothetical protein
MKTKLFFKLISLILLAVIVLNYPINVVFADNPVQLTAKDDLSKIKVGDKVVQNKNTVDKLVSKTLKSNGKTQYTYESTISSLPQYLDDLKTKIDPTWYFDKNNNTYTVGPNLFIASVIETTVTIINSSNETVTWDPNVTLNNIIYYPKSRNPIITSDLYNENYSSNTLMWDYNICKRYIRVIEGLIQELYVFDKNPKGDVLVNDNIVKSLNFKGIVKYEAWDSKFNHINNNGLNGILSKEFDRKDIVYPITLDPTFVAGSSSSDGYNVLGYSGSAVWTLAHNADGTYGVESVSSSLMADVGVTKNYILSYFVDSINRSYLYFDTSFLTGKTITGAQIGLYGATVYSSIGSWTLEVQSGSPTYPNDPLVATDYYYSNYSGNGGTLASNFLSIGTYDIITLNSTGYGWINRDGITKYCLREVEHDINNSAPTDSTSLKANLLEYYTAEKGNGYFPVMVIDYVSDVPTININSASNITSNTARLNSTLTNSGGNLCTIEFGWDTISRGITFANYTHTGTVSGTYNTGDTPYLDISGLSSNTTYYYNVQATNSIGPSIGTEGSFTTITGISNITSNVSIYPTSTTIILNWIKASGSTNSYIYEQTTPFTGNITDGTLIYSGTGSTFTHTSLISGTTYYYALISYNSGSTTFGDTPYYIESTTLLYNNNNSSIAIPIEPDKWNQTSSGNKLQNFTPFWSVSEGLRTDLNMPDGVFYLGLTFLFMIIFGLAALLLVGSGTGAFIAMILVFVIGMMLGTVPMVAGFIIVIISIGILFMAKGF